MAPTRRKPIVKRPVRDTLAEGTSDGARNGLGTRGPSTTTLSAATSGIDTNSPENKKWRRVALVGGALRPAKAASMPVVPFGAPPRPPTKTKEVQIAEVRDQAWALGNVLQDVRKWDKMMSNAIASRLSRRVGEDVYQCAAIRMHGVPREALTRWMPPPTTRNEKELSWEFESASEVVRTTIDPTDAGNVGRFINHSCDPNLRAFVVRAGSLVPRVALFAVRDIEELQELTMFYGDGAGSTATPLATAGRTKCLCAEPCCTGFLPCDTD
ncbi:hypothetical protein AB1Y20_008373 [Prymnesium parvum]|uniref:SET domain-containing protein n=1 Tax=Prymnesium parvum TaxID=97485 RepID=A0AB34ISX3_PRYPA